MPHPLRYFVWIFIVGLLIIPNDTVSSQDDSSLPFTMKWSPDGTMLAVGYDNGHFEIVDASNGEKLTSFTGHIAMISDIDWSPDQNFIATGSIDRTVKVWDLTKVYEVLEIEGLPFATVSVVAWRSDVNRIIVAQQGRVGDNLFEWDPDRQTIDYSEAISTPTQVIWNPAVDELAISFLLYRVEIRDRSSMKILKVLELDRPPRTDNLVATGPVVMAWEEDGEYLLTGGLTGEVILWDMEHESTVIEDVSSQNTNLAETRVTTVWFREELAFSLAQDGTLRAWNTHTGKLVSETQISERVLVADVNTYDQLLAYFDGDQELHVVGLSELEELAMHDSTIE